MAADDGYERYYTEKLWQMLPELYRTEDGGGTDGDPLRQKDVLRQLIEGVSKQSADRDETRSLPARAIAPDPASADLVTECRVDRRR
jgi:hypothetical protein